MLNSTEHKFSTAQKLKYWQMKKFLALSLSEYVFILLINVKMPFNIYEQDKFDAQLSWVWNKFCNLGPSSYVRR